MNCSFLYRHLGDCKGYECACPKVLHDTNVCKRIVLLFGGTCSLNALDYRVDKGFKTLALNDMVLTKLYLIYYYLAFTYSQLTYRSLFDLMHWECLSK